MQGGRRAVQEKLLHVFQDQFSISTTTKCVALKKYVNIIIIFTARQLVRDRPFAYINAYGFDTTGL